MSLHDTILDHADALMDVAEREMADAVAAGEDQRAAHWIDLAVHLAAGIRPYILNSTTNKGTADA